MRLRRSCTECLRQGLCASLTRRSRTATHSLTHQAFAVAQPQRRSLASARAPQAPEAPVTDFAEVFRKVVEERRASQEDLPTTKVGDARTAPHCSTLVAGLISAGATSGPSPRDTAHFPQHVFPNLETAKLTLEKPRGDGIFDAVFARHGVSLETTEASSQSIRGHRPLSGRSVNTAMDAARVLVRVLTEVAEAFAATEPQGMVDRHRNPGGRHLLRDGAFLRAVCEQAFLTAFFTIQHERENHSSLLHHELPTLLSAHPAYATYPYLDTLSGLHVPVREALEVCLARLLVASPFSFHVGLEFLAKWRALGDGSDLVLTLFRLWWFLNPDQVPLELNTLGPRALPALFNDATRQFEASHTAAETRQRTEAYKAGVMAALLSRSREAQGDGSLDLLTPELFYPRGQQNDYQMALQAVACETLASGECKYNITCPLLPRVVQLSAVTSALPRRTQTRAGGGNKMEMDRRTVPGEWSHDQFVQDLFHHSFVPMACQPAAQPSAEGEAWLTLCGLATAAGMLNAQAKKLRTLPRAGKSAAAGQQAASDVSLDGMAHTTYEGEMEALRNRFVTCMGVLVQSTAVPSDNSDGTSNLSSEVRDWALFVFNAVSSTFEFAGAFNPSAAHRPLVAADLWRRLHREGFEKFPHVFNGGDSPVPTLFTLFALESAAHTPSGKLCEALAVTSMGRETALARWRAHLAGHPTLVTIPDDIDGLWESLDDDNDGTTTHLGGSSHQKRVNHLVTRVLSPSSSQTANSSPERLGNADSAARHQQHPHRRFTQPVDRAAKDIEYPPHTFVAGCGAVSPTLAGATPEASDEVHAAFTRMQRAVLAITRAHVQVPLPAEGLQTGGNDVCEKDAPPLLTKEAGAINTQSTVSTRKVSFFVLLKALQRLATIGETGERSVNGKTNENLVVSCVTTDILPHARPIVGAYCAKLAVQSLLHSTPAAGALLLLGKDSLDSRLLDYLSSDDAWGKILVMLMWSGLPSGDALNVLLAARNAGDAADVARETEKRNRASVPPPVFGSGSLAWFVMADELDPTAMAVAQEGSEEEEGIPGGTGTHDNIPSRVKSDHRMHRCLAVALDHLLALALETPDPFRVPVTLHSLLDSPTAQTLVSGLLTSSHKNASGTTETESRSTEVGAPPLPQASPREERGPVEHDDDFNDYAYLMDNEDEPTSDNAFGGTTEPGEVDGEEAGVSPILSHHFTSSDELLADSENAALLRERDGKERRELHRVATAGGTSNSDQGHGPDEQYEVRVSELHGELKRRLRGVSPPAAHLYLSFLEAAGVVAMTAAGTYARLPSVSHKSTLLSIMGYHALAMALETAVSEGAESDSEGTAEAAGSVPPAALAPFRKVVAHSLAMRQLILFQAHTVADVRMLATMLLQLMTTRARAAHKGAPQDVVLPPLLFTEVVSAICQVLHHAGITRCTVDAWRESLPMPVWSEAHGVMDVVQHHRELLSKLKHKATVATEKDFLMLLGSLALLSLEPKCTQVRATSFDQRDYYIHAFMRSPHTVDRVTGADAAVAVVIPSQQLVRFTTAAGSDAPRRAQTWTEVKRRTRVSGIQHVDDHTREPTEANPAVAEAVASLQASEFTSLFTS